MAKRKRGRPKVELAITDVERVELLRLTKRTQVNRSIAFRARIVLGCADDSSNISVAERLRTTDQTVGKWRNRFIASRLDGLYDEPRVGGPRKITDEQVEAVVVKTLETKPKGETHWSTRGMAAKVGMSHTMIGKTWRTFGLKPHITKSFKISPDPQLVDKVRDVVGLYMNPPNNAVVFSFDEVTVFASSIARALGAMKTVVAGLYSKAGHRTFTSDVILRNAPFSSAVGFSQSLVSGFRYASSYEKYPGNKQGVPSTSLTRAARHWRMGPPASGLIANLPFAVPPINCEYAMSWRVNDP